MPVSCVQVGVAGDDHVGAGAAREGDQIVVAAVRAHGRRVCAVVDLERVAGERVDIGLGSPVGCLERELRYAV